MGVTNLGDDVVLVCGSGREVEEVVSQGAWYASKRDGAEVPRSHDEGTEHHAERAPLGYASGPLVWFPHALC